jgi:hypothetical protein
VISFIPESPSDQFLNPDRDNFGIAIHLAPESASSRFTGGGRLQIYLLHLGVWVEHRAEDWLKG